MFLTNRIPWIKNRIDLPKELAKAIKKTPHMTIDEFYNRFKIPRRARTNFGTAALLYEAEQYL